MSTTLVPSTIMLTPSHTPPLSPSLQEPNAYQLTTWTTIQTPLSTSQSTSFTNSGSTSMQSGTSTMATSILPDAMSIETSNTTSNTTTTQNTAAIASATSLDILDSTRLNWFLQGLPSKFWQGINQGPLKYIIAVLKRLGRVLNTHVSFDKSTMMISLVLVIIFGIPTWRSLILQIWTSKKDFLEYCSDDSVCCKEKLRRTGLICFQDPQDRKRTARL
jgi:hypothetical protein